MRFPCPDPSLLEVHHTGESDHPWILCSTDPVWLQETAGRTGIVGRFKTRAEAEGWRSTSIANTTRLWARECGECHACCIALTIPQLDKPPDTPCRHLTVLPDGQCGIFEERPNVCRNYFCGWRFGLGNDKERPDRLGLLLNPQDNRDDTGLPLDNVSFLARELWPGAAASKPARRYLAILRFSGLVIFLKVGDKIITLAKPDLLVNIQKWCKCNGFDNHMAILASWELFQASVRAGVLPTP